MAKILITGGTGLIGNALCKKLLENGHDVSVLTRTLIKSSTIKYFLWDVNKSIIDEKAFDGIEHIVHLAGCGIADKKWTPERMKEILDSRVNASELILSVLKKRNIKLKSFVGASAVGIYSARTSQRIYTENDLGLDDFLSDTCIAWENSYYDLEDFSERYAIARISVVLAKEGGALKKLLPIFKKRFKVINLNKIRTSAKYKIGNWYMNKKQAARNLSTASIVNTKKVRFCSNVAILTNFITYIILSNIILMPTKIERFLIRTLSYNAKLNKMFKM